MPIPIVVTLDLDFQEASEFLFRILYFIYLCVLQLIMPKKNKKATETGHKKATSVKAKRSATATTYTDMDLNGSFLTPSGGTIVSTASSSQPPPPSSDPITGNDTVLAYLQRIDATNQALLKRVDDLESQCINPSMVQATKATLEQGPPTVPIMTHSRQPGHQHSSSNSISSSQAGYPQAVTNSTSSSVPAAQMMQNSHLHDAVIPDVKAIRANPTISLIVFYVAFNSQGYIATGSLQVEDTSAYCTVNHRASASNYQLSNMKRPARDSNPRPQRLEARSLTATPPSPPPTISQSVSHILSSLEAGSRAEATQGKATHKKSGRFNTTDTITAAPELRWPNEGFHGIGGRKRTLYDDLTIH